MICPNCGKEAADGALFCTGCGGRLDNLPKQEKMTASENSNNDDSSVMDAVFTSDAADGTHETNSGNTVAENSDVAGADENSGERMSAANDNNLKAQPANRISTEKNKNAAPCESAAAVQPPVKPLSTWSFIWRKLLFMIPIVNIVVLFVFAFAEGINKNSRSYARVI
ncbi:MAG TPA: zinc-ribbon domain-containing protein [Clostridia bacterium]|nr:zinc-ribbon domain-containing protein [Clostridia bacterium]